MTENTKMFTKQLPVKLEENITFNLMNEKEIGKQYSIGNMIFELKTVYSMGVSYAWYDSGPTKTVYKMIYNNEYIGDFVMK